MIVKEREVSITVCSCSSRNIMNRAEISRLVSALKNAGYTVITVPDLCKTAISNAEQMAVIASTTVVACYPRAIRAIFDRLGLKPRQVFDIRNHSSEQVLKEMGISNPVFLPEPEHPYFPESSPEPKRSYFPEFSPESELPYFPEFSPEEEPEAWNPVIDKERCTECGKCHDFCLFGVYAIEGGTVKVARPQSCKNNCPACARACPSKAIIFPKYEKSPINGGLHDEEQLGEMNTKALYNSALKHRLEERRAKVSLLRKK